MLFCVKWQQPWNSDLENGWRLLRDWAEDLLQMFCIKCSIRNASVFFVSLFFTELAWKPTNRVSSCIRSLLRDHASCEFRTRVWKKGIDFSKLLAHSDKSLLIRLTAIRNKLPQRGADDLQGVIKGQRNDKVHFHYVPPALEVPNNK